MKCWYCEEELMQKAPDLGEGWFRCANCKATNNPPYPKPGASALGAKWLDKARVAHYHSVKPRKSKKTKK